MADVDEDTMAVPFSAVRPYPKKIVLNRIGPKAESALYFKRIYCNAIITMFDDDNTIGTSTCSNCNNALGLFEKFCPHCGAKIKGKCILDKNGNEIE